MRDLTEHERDLLQRITEHTCESCGTKGTFALHDTVTYSREWQIRSDGFSYTCGEQSDATPYEVLCVRCGRRLDPLLELPIDYADLQELIDLKDASQLEDL